MSQPYNYIVNPMTQFRPIDFSGIERGMARKGLRENQQARQNEFGAGLKGLKQGGDPNELMGRFPDQQKQIIQQLDLNKQQKLEEDYDALDKNDPIALKAFHNKHTDPNDAVGQQIASLKEEQKKSLALQGGQAYMRFLSGDTDGAIGGLKQYGELLKEQDPQMSAFILDNTEKLKGMEPGDQAVMLSGIVERLDPEILVRAKERAGIKKTESETKETDAKTLAIKGEESRAQGMAKISDMDDDAKKLFIANDKELAMNNEEARKLDSLSAQMISKEDGKPIEFGGAPETYMRQFNQFWTGMSDNDPQKDLLIKELKGVALSAAFKLKQAGAMSDPEFNQYISTVPTANDSEKIVGPWINNVINNNKKAFAALTISNKFLEANGTAKSAKEKFVIDIDGKKITVNKGNSVQTILRKVGQNLADFAPSIGGSEDNKGKGSQSLTAPAGSTPTGFNFVAPNGQSITFPNQAAADAFRKKAGL